MPIKVNRGDAKNQTQRGGFQKKIALEGVKDNKLRTNYWTGRNTDNKNNKLFGVKYKDNSNNKKIRQINLDNIINNKKDNKMSHSK